MRECASRCAAQMRDGDSLACELLKYASMHGHRDDNRARRLEKSCMTTDSRSIIESGTSVGVVGGWGVGLLGCG
ncbi:hypothetical protein V9T40_009678 [Parthenolecanium corni]|uniref:Uncharacterized protein n=1 Tax=Parthenolecanium corni TaxID=536013 RepID=A0AAN9Y910_9HEMI